MLWRIKLSKANKVVLSSEFLSELPLEKMQHLKKQVQSLSPQSTLDRGYAVVRNLEGNVLTNPKQTKAGQKLRITLSGGDLGATAD
jgi:exodeoxyribonuclease VII large subunit